MSVEDNQDAITRIERGDVGQTGRQTNQKSTRDLHKTLRITSVMLCYKNAQSGESLIMLSKTMKSLKAGVGVIITSSPTLSIVLPPGGNRQMNEERNIVHLSSYELNSPSQRIFMGYRDRLFHLYH